MGGIREKREGAGGVNGSNLAAGQPSNHGHTTTDPTNQQEKVYFSLQIHIGRPSNHGHMSNKSDPAIPKRFQNICSGMICIPNIFHQCHQYIDVLFPDNVLFPTENAKGTAAMFILISCQ